MTILEGMFGPYGPVSSIIYKRGQRTWTEEVILTEVSKDNNGRPTTVLETELLLESQHTTQVRL